MTDSGVLISFKKFSEKLPIKKKTCPTERLKLFFKMISGYLHTKQTKYVPQIV